MESNAGPQSGINAWLEEELLQQYQHDRGSVDAEWKTVFEHETGTSAVALAGNVYANGKKENGTTDIGTTAVALAAPVAAAATTPAAVLALSPSEELVPLRGAPARIA